jgi:hypothetical protein
MSFWKKILDKYRNKKKKDSNALLENKYLQQLQNKLKLNKYKDKS